QRLIEYRVRAADASEHAWRMTATDWRHAQDCEAVQALLRGWQAFAPALPADYLTRATHAIRAARTLDLHDTADLVLIGMYVLQVHPRLCEHPEIRECVRHARERQQPLVDALGAIPDPPGWYRMRDELTKAAIPAQTTRSQRHG